MGSARSRSPCTLMAIVSITRLVAVVSRSFLIAVLGPMLMLSACAPDAPSSDPAAPASPPDPLSVAYLRADTTSGFPFSDAVRVGPMLYLSGQIGTDSTGALVAGGIASETRQTMDNIRAVLERNGSSMDDVVKCTVMVEDIAQWGDVNAIYRTYFPNHFPARSALGADGLALGALVEIECWAVVR